MLAEIRADLDSRGLLGLDSADEIGSITVQLAGTYELIDKARDALASATEYPREVLLNEAPNGLRGGELSGATIEEKLTNLNKKDANSQILLRGDAGASHGRVIELLGVVRELGFKRVDLVITRPKPPAATP